MRPVAPFPFPANDKSETKVTVLGPGLCSRTLVCDSWLGNAAR
jgi:hypothetical protein